MQYQEVNKIMSHVSELRLEDLPDVEPYLINKLKRAGIQSVLDLAASIPIELAGGGGDYYRVRITQQLQLT